jgi:hypothetical protein
MPWVGFETTTPMFERAKKTIHALHCVAAVIGFSRVTKTVMNRNSESIKTVRAHCRWQFFYINVCIMHLNHKKRPEIIWINACYEVLSAVIMKSSIFCDSSVLSASYCFLIWLNLQPWRWEWYDHRNVGWLPLHYTLYVNIVPLKFHFLFEKQHINFVPFVSAVSWQLSSTSLF